MVSVVLGSGLGPAGRIPFDVTAAGIAVVAEGLSEFGRFLRWRISLKPSGVTGVTVPPLIAPPPDLGGLEDGLVVRLSGYHVFADMIPVHAWSKSDLEIPRFLRIRCSVPMARSRFPCLGMGSPARLLD